MITMSPIWLCLCCLAAWPVWTRSESQATPPANEDDQRPPAQFPIEISQHDVLPDAISREFLMQKIQENLQDGQQLPILIHGEPQSVPLQPRGRGPHCKEVGCTRKVPFYKLEEFPPGRPSLSNLGALCSAQRKKPSYGPWNLPQTSFSHLVRQGEALNQLELQFTRCCQLDEDQKLPCASNEWEKCLARYCKQEFSTKTLPFHCCRAGDREARLSCFSRQAPFPKFEGLQTPSPPTASPGFPSLLAFLNPECGIPPFVLLSRKPSPALVQNITESCCKLPESERTLCAQGVKSQFITAFCSSQRRSWRDPQRCCVQTEEATRNDCFDRSYLGHVSLLRRQQEEEEAEEAVEEIVLPTGGLLNPPGA
ncbi:hypothetical protein E2320_014083 [Naja naja]|nr:hypothetical protein E2320_014083 [Naja naja]